MAKRSLSNYGVPYQELGNEEIKRFILAFLIAIMVILIQIGLNTLATVLIAPLPCGPVY